MSSAVIENQAWHFFSYPNRGYPSLRVNVTYTKAVWIAVEWVGSMIA